MDMSDPYFTMIALSPWYSLLSGVNELPRRKQRGIIKSIERPKGRGIQHLSASGGFNYFKDVPNSTCL